MIKLKGIKKLKGEKKKYAAVFEKNGKEYVRKFGAAGMSDFTIHKDTERRERYISRHKKDLRTGDPMRAGYLSMYILWNKPSLQASITDFKRRLNIYNKTGKFPKDIKGSKKLSFGEANPCSAEALTNFPEDIQRLIKQQCAATIIQSVGKKMDSKRSLFEALTIRGLQRYKDAAKTTSNPRENMRFISKLWTNLDPVNDFTAKWLIRASKALVKSDFDFNTRNFWWKVVDNQLETMNEIEGDGDPSQFLTQDEYSYYEQCKSAIMVILNKVRYPKTDNNSEGWTFRALKFWRDKKTNTFGKKKVLFGMKRSAEIKDILADKVRWDPAQLILEYRAAPEIQRLARGFIGRRFVKSKEYLKMILYAINIDYYVSRKIQNPEQRAKQEMESDSGTPWQALKLEKYYTAFFLQRCANILTESDKTDRLWFNCILTVLNQIDDLDPDTRNWRKGKEKDVIKNIENCIDSVIDLLPILTDVYPDLDEPRWYRRAIMELEETGQANQFGKKNKTSGSKIPDNVVNKKLYESIKEKIRKSIKGRRWGAYDSGRLVREYKAKGGKYRGSKGKTDLGRWYKEKWVDACAWPKRKACGRKTKEKIAYCRPSKRVDSKTPKLVQELTKAQIKSRCAKKKKSPMKRVTKFGNKWRVNKNGNAYSDEVHFPLDVNWTIHCSYIKSIDGTHVTLRKNDGVPGEEDHSIHYGIPNWAPDGPAQWWATGPRRHFLIEGKSPTIPLEWQNWIINYYNEVCSTLLFPAEVRGPSVYAKTGLPPKSPKPSFRFGNMYSVPLS